MSLVLEQMKDIEDRSAKFVAVIALLYKGQTRLFKGEVGGTIALERSGVRGFGYDPIFIPQGYERSFADLPSEVKNEISHRKKALVQLKEFLKYG
jgi:XTP/dITP diphosphohydrolase